MFDRIGVGIAETRTRPFDFAVVDEAQDLGVAEARFLAALGGGRPNALFFAGDLGQRIFQAPFSWKSLGLDIRGRSSTLRVNYRTNHQIRSQADRLLPTAISDVDGNEEGRKGAVSVFDGPPPVVEAFKSADKERPRSASGSGADEGGRTAARDRRLRPLGSGSRSGASGGDGGRRSGCGFVGRRRSRRRLDRSQSMHLAKGLIPRRRGDGLR